MAVTKKIDPASAKSKTTGKPIQKKQTLRGKGLKKKKEHLRYGIDCTNIAEDNILDVADFVSFPSSLIHQIVILINSISVIAGEILEGTLQGQRQDRKLGQQRVDGATKVQNLRQL
jgi:hypothetical protein